MKTRILLIIWLFIFAQQGIVQAQNDSIRSNQPDFNTWTEEQIKHWEDSVRNARYPDLELITANADESRNNKDEDNGNTNTRATINTYVPSSVIIDKNRTVGEIPMTSAVSPTGAITYQVPIDVYPGRQGLQPQLSIVYNSQSGNGVLGMGWGVSGLSSVNRGARSMYYDNIARGVDMTKDDAFYLDGMRLIKTDESSTYIKYESEHGNILATAYLNGTLIRYFDVFYPNGTKGTYGYTGNSATNYLEYPLTTLYDLYGNTVTYTYTYVYNHYRIDGINYDNASVEFQYKTDAREDVITTYNAGLKIIQNKLLQKIICKYDKTVLRNYDFTYSTNKNTSVLAEIGYSAANGSSFNSLKFYYGEDNNNFEYSVRKSSLSKYFNFTDLKQVIVKTGKIEYDSDNDGLMVLPMQNTYRRHHRSSSMFQHSQDRFFNEYTGLESIVAYTKLDNSTSQTSILTTTGEGFIDILCANIDGIGEDEVIKVNNKVSGNDDQVIFTSYYAHSSGGFMPCPSSPHIFNLPTVLTDNDGGTSVHPKFYFAGNFTGDGKTKVLAVSCHHPFGWTSNPTNCYLFDLESNTILYEGQQFAFNVTFIETQNSYMKYVEDLTDKLFVLDYDGDGKSDICLINELGTFIYTFDVSGSTCSMRLIASFSSLNRQWLEGRLLLFGDFNGDGKLDFMCSPKVGDYGWYVFCSMGNGQFEAVDPFTYPKIRNSSSRYVLQDVNSDGFTDFIEINSSDFITYMNNNGYFSTQESQYYFSGSNHFYQSIDIYGQNEHSNLFAMKDNYVTLFSYPRNDTKEKLLTGSVTSLGVVSKNYYNTLLKTSGIHTIGSDANFPYINIRGPIFVAECREQYFNGQMNEKLSWTYESAVIHKQGLGFRGFGKINTNDKIRGRSSYQKFAPYNYCELLEENSPATKITNTYSTSKASNQIAKLRLTNQSVQDKLKGVTVTTGYTYGTFGSPVTQTVNYGGVITESFSNVYYINTNTQTGYLLDFLTDQTKTVKRNNATWMERFIIYEHDYKGQPKTLVRFVNGNTVSSENFTYDASGNRNTHEVTPFSSSKTFTTKYNYDSYGRMINQTDPLEFITTYEYYPTNGSLYKVKNHKNQVTEYFYDDFLRNNKVSYPDGIYTSSNYSWDARGTNGLYLKTDFQSGEPRVKTYFDALGRKTATSGFNFDYSEPCTEILYDDYGRLSEVSLPFLGSAATNWNTYQYDDYDRMTLLTEASGRITSYSYDGNSVTTTSDGIASTKNFDAQGNLTSVVEPAAGTITYNLRPDGQPSSIVAPGNVTTSFSYDDNGYTLGNFINLNLTDEITGSFDDLVLSDPFFMHEYGHTFDSRIFGPSYLFAVGISSKRAFNNSEAIRGDAYGRETGDVHWTEMRANRHAAKYFGKHFNVNWDYLNLDNTKYWHYPLRYSPTNRTRVQGPVKRR